MQAIKWAIHPSSWWLLGGALAILAGSAINVFTPLAISLVSIALILIFRENATWAKSLSFYLYLAGLVVAIRILFRIVFSYSSFQNDIALALPRFQLNLGFTQIEFLGKVSWTSLNGALVDGLRLAAIILAVALATTLANPRKLLKNAPGALYEIATSVSVAINLAPQLIESLHRVRRARSLRGKSKRTSRLTGIVIPIIEDTLDRSLLLAASMDARGFGRRGKQSNSELFIARLLGLIALLANLFGIFTLLSGLGDWLALILIGFGIVSGLVSVKITSRRKVRTSLNKQARSAADYSLLVALIGLLVANFAGWLR